MRVLSLCCALLAGAAVAYPVKSVEAPHRASLATATPLDHSLTERPRVAVIDSGVARTDELKQAVVAEFDMASDTPRTAYQPHDHHGTMVATILLRAAQQPIDIISLRIDDPAGCPAGLTPPCQQDAAPVARAIRKATELGVSAINISLSLKEDPAIVDAVRDAAEHGITVVLAAGNEGRSRPGNLTMAIAAYPRAVLVGAPDAQGHPWKGTNRPTRSVPGYRYVWQRGVGVPTTLANGTAVIATGTSFAAPIETARLIGPAASLGDASTGA